MSKRTVTIEIDDTIEIHNATDFAKWAGLFGVEVGERGRKPKAQLARAIREYSGDDLPTTIVDTDYFAASMADEGKRETSEYGVKLADLRAVREAAIADAHATFERDRDALRAAYGVTVQGASKATGNGFVVSARTPMLDKETGAVLRTKSEGDRPGKVKFLPSARKVELSLARVRELTGTTGQRGRVSQPDTLRAAVIEGGWFPVELTTTDGWDTVLLKDVTVEPVTVSAS